MTIDELIEKVERIRPGALKELREKRARGESLTIGEEEKVFDLAKNAREGSRFTNTPEARAENERVARELGIDLNAVKEGRGDAKIAPNPHFRQPQSGAGLLRDMVLARKGDMHALVRVTGGTKVWNEGTDTAGGFFVQEQQLPGYYAKRKAASPVRGLATEHNVNSNEVWVVVEDGSVTVAPTPEAAQKPFSVGSVARKVSVVHKLAGTTEISDELVADGNGAPEQLISEQFGSEIGQAINRALHSGTGVGQPTGVRFASGVNSVAVDGQSGQALYNSLVKGLGRLRTRFHDPSEVTVLLHPRDLVRVDLAVDSGGSYLFPGGLAEHLPCAVQTDATLPVSLGAGGNESLVLVGAFKAGLHVFSRQPLTLEVSSDAGFTRDVTVVRAVERYGAMVVAPSAFEVLTGLTPA